MTPRVLTVDAGTTSVKVCLFESDLTLLAKSVQEYSLAASSGRVEAEGGTYIEAVRRGVRALGGLAGSVTAVCLTTQGETLTQLLARRDALKLRVEAYQQLLRAASQTWQRATGSEIRVLSAVDVKTLRRRSDDLARDLRKLDNRIQALNWTTDVEI